MIISSLLCFLFPETKDTDLEDTMSKSGTSNRKGLMLSGKRVLNVQASVDNSTDVNTKTEDNEVAVTKF